MIEYTFKHTTTEQKMNGSITINGIEYAPITRTTGDRAAIAATDHDAVRIMQTVIQKGHDYVLVVEPRDSGSRMQMNSGMRRIEVARMLEQFAREAREDARFGGDE